MRNINMHILSRSNRPVSPGRGSSLARRFLGLLALSAAAIPGLPAAASFSAYQAYSAGGAPEGCVFW
ncbi:MAG: hypothetical protein ACE5HD_12485 [Acidobacteriota bacterium]